MPRSNPLDAVTLEAYRQRGVVRLGTVLEAAEVERLRAALDDLRATRTASAAGMIVHDTWRLAPDCEAVVRAPALARLACRLLGRTQVTLFQDNLVWKLPGSTSIEWHQDYSYQPLSTPAGITLWLSLDHTTPESGCLHYVPGSHRLGECAPADFVAGSGQPRRDDLPPLDIDAHRDAIEAFPTTPGELLAHHPLVWHMSPENQTAVHRRAISINWLAADVRWQPTHAPHPYNYALAPADDDPLDGARFPVFDMTVKKEA